MNKNKMAVVLILAVSLLSVQVQGYTIAPSDTIESVTAEVTALQSKLDNILYPAYYKDLSGAFSSLSYIYGGHNEFQIKDDVLKFHDIPVH